MDFIWQDFRQTLRGLIKAPGFTLTVVATLGLAIGANTAIFGLLDRTVFRPLPVPKPDELVVLSAPPLPVPTGPMVTVGGRARGGQRLHGFAYPVYKALRERVAAFAGVMAYSGLRANLLAGDTPVQIQAELVAGNYFDVLGVRAALGRLLTPDDDRTPGAHPVVVLGHAFWRQQFGGDPTLLNRTVRLNGHPMEIVGIAPPEFGGMVPSRPPDLFAPMTMSDRLVRTSGLTFDAPGRNVLSVVARLAPGVSREQAEAVADGVYRQLLDDAMAADPRLSEKDRAILATQHLVLIPGGSAGSQQPVSGRTNATALTLLMGMVGLVLVIAAGNVSNLLVARGAARARETAIRLALGASRWRLLRQLLIESAVLSAAAGGVGLVASSWLAGVLPALLGATRLAPAPEAGALDARVVAFAAAAAAATGVLIWLVSALHGTRQSNLPALGDQSASPARRAGGLGLRRGVVLLQVGLCTTLLCGSVLLSRSFIGLMLVDPGFATANLLAFSITPDPNRHEGDRGNRYYADALEQVSRLPGVASASMVSELPFSGAGSGTWLVGDASSLAPEKPILIAIVEIGPAYFSTLGVRLAAGREFTAEDAVSTPKVAVINETLATRLFGSRPAVGRRVGFEQQPLDTTVVGVVRDARGRSLRTAPEPTMFVPRFQTTHARPMSVVARLAGPAAPSLSDVRAVLGRIDSAVPVTGFASMDEHRAASLARERVLAAVASTFGGLASALASIGLLGLTSYTVSRRVREIGIRVALGATRAAIIRLVLREVTALALAGGVIGVAAFAGAGRFLQAFLFELSPTDPLTIALAVLLLGAVTLGAGFVPARRAARLDPAMALRHE